ncbi:aromatase/cyclase [Kibdelosporangium persicum]|uniref:Actinorhodin polyketide synthase bifunctional cyclase/dehydratase n=1 Tax=Kibdelosporangium persicum TaxID=2698649 RepID=A0ABX2F7H2_9PSEU|nr:aromatase/cyclase [Kibdelosporangium persicum]NRN67222.1 Actinorhodin polyketide synthase bifunctional cyclase/dehydratase [Kibdelosporangium persicum]
MSNQNVREVEHEITVDAGADEVYRLLAECVHWPRLFPPTVYVDRTGISAEEERIRIWATANGEAKNWTSRRWLKPAERRIDFRQEVSPPPVASMGGGWIIEPLSDKQSRVRLRHDYRAIDDDPESLKWIDEAVDSNSRKELGALKANIERATVTAEEDLLLSFTDTVEIAGSAKDVYEFVNEAGKWTERLPHVARVSLQEDTPGLQILEMDTRTKDGSTHTTKSVRVCFPNEKIVYKQTTLPALMALHTGYWEFVEHDAGVTATSEHTVVINTANVTEILGADATVADAKQFVRNALSTNSRATLGHAKDYAEKRS